jgi:hypothetical protein
MSAAVKSIVNGHSIAGLEQRHMFKKPGHAAALGHGLAVRIKNHNCFS